MIEILENYHGKPLIHTWTYCATDGAPFGVVGRYQDTDGKKDIVPFFKRNGSTFGAGIELNPRPLFGLDKLAIHPNDKAVFIVEGEKSAAALHSIGLTAITSLGGSKAAKQADWMPLNACKKIYLMPDKDSAGEDYMKDVYGALMALPEPPLIKAMSPLNVENFPELH
jgi:Toprim-like